MPKKNEGRLQILSFGTFKKIKTMSTTEKNLTPEESLSIISRNIEQSRRAMVKNGGTPMLIWGCLTLVFSLAIYFLWVKTYNPAWNYLWFAMTAIGYMIMAFLPNKKGPRVESVISVVLGKVWIAFGIISLATPSVTLIIFRAIKDIIPSSMFSGVIFFPITLIITALLGLATAITGLILKNGWITAAGIICGIIGSAFAIALNGPEQTLLLTGVSVIGLIIPGIMLNIKAKRDE